MAASELQGAQVVLGGLPYAEASALRAQLKALGASVSFFVNSSVSVGLGGGMGCCRRVDV